ncbi:MAG: phosphate ABC transporter permease PstA [Synechococcales cyanobacterium M58_A2018_015]|nr:phosphate ABC transporter permease PstA [Synechococcales cyanobacterium M58_A2018_015]
MTSTDYSFFPDSDRSQAKFVPNQMARHRLDWAFAMATWTATLIALAVLATLLIDVATDGIPRINWQFLSSFPSRRPEQAGILSALVGSFWLLGVVVCVGFPVGVGAGIFLEEFAKRSRLTGLLEINISNLAGVPSIIYGLLGLQMFVRVLQPITGGRTVLAGGLTLSLLVLPIIIVATREALRAVPSSLREAGYALGVARWRIVWGIVLPQAFSGILTGTILALARAIGETASLITIGALTFIAFLPPLSLEGLRTPFTALPIQTFNWVSRPQAAFHTNAAAAIVVLMVVLLSMNATAIYLRDRLRRNQGLA